MHNTKLINLIIYIHEEEKLAVLHKYLGRQYAKNDGVIFILWEHLKKYIARGSYKSKLLNRDYIQENIFNNDKKALNRTASRLYRHIKNYMIEDYLSENEIIYDWLFRESIKNDKSRLKEIMTEKLVNDERKSKNRIEDALQLFIKFHLVYEKYQEQSLINSDVQLFNKSRELFREYYARYYSILEAEKRQREKTFNEEIVSLASLTEYEIKGLGEPEILFEQTKRLEENPNIEDFNYCKDTFLKLVEAEKISREMELAIFSEIMNFANRQAKKGNNDYFFPNINYFIDLGLNKKILYVKDNLTMYIYTNFLSFVATDGELEEIKNYVDNYVKDVDKKDLEKAKFLSDLYIEFYGKNYQTVIDKIIFNENDITIGLEYSLKIRIWVFLMCSYYEVRNEEALIRTMNSFRRYLKNQMISDIVVQIYMNLIQFIREIFRANTINELDKIEKQLTNEKLITYEKWLQEKIKESRLRLTETSTP